ncbi:MAG TPA: carbohydrate-binding protein [Ruminiclostridium sp.]
MVKEFYENNGILVSPKEMYSGDKVKLSYTGLLAQAGAESIFLHVGFGDKWENSLLIPMNFEQGIFSAELDVIDNKSFGVCFKDSAENWDNNSGENYVFKVSTKSTKKEKTVIAKPTKTVDKTTKSKSIKTEATKLKTPKSNNKLIC